MEASLPSSYIEITIKLHGYTWQYMTMHGYTSHYLAIDGNTW